MGKEEGGKGGGEFCSHGNTVFLGEDFSIKSEHIVLQHIGEKLA